MGRLMDAWMVFACVMLAFNVAGAAEINVITPQWKSPTEFDGITRGQAWLSTDPSGSIVCGKCFIDDAHLMMDRKRKTVMTTPSKADVEYAKTRAFMMLYRFSYKVKVIRYRIHVGEGTPKSWYPKSWTLYGESYIQSRHEPEAESRHELAELHKVTNAKFKNGVFVGKFHNPSKYQRILLLVTEDSTPGDDEMRIKIAEFEAFGPRGQYDRFVSGGFPCRKAARYMTRTGSKKDGTAFTNSPDLGKGNLNKIFNDKSYERVGVNFPDNGRLILGYFFRRAVQVVQFGPEKPYQYGGRGLVLEANECDPTCEFLGEAGWKVVAEGSRFTHAARKWLVKKPGFYRAYRLKLGRLDSFKDRQTFYELTFLQC